MMRLTRIIDIIAPARCVHCGSVVPHECHDLCNECYVSIVPVTEKCIRCSGPLRDGRCMICGDRAFYLASNIAVAEYEGAMKSLLSHYKAMRNKRLSRHFIAMIAGSVSVRELQCQVITSVPMAPYKKWKRGYNHSEEIARGISRRFRIPYRTVLRDTGGSLYQKRLGSRERFFNVLGRYRAVRTDSIRDRSVLLVDDVYTTGATLNECARVLLDGGASQVCGITAARSIKGIAGIMHAGAQ
jgi:competence protein ComFC